VAAQEDGRPASWLRAVHLCPARVLVFPSPSRPVSTSSQIFLTASFGLRAKVLNSAEDAHLETMSTFVRCGSPVTER
jgi:hypothetical protein